MRWLAKSDAVAVSDDGASCSHECNSWDTACGDTWFSQGIATIELLTDEVDRPSLYAGIVSRDHIFEEDTAGLFAEASLAVCFGGKGQRVTIGEIKVDTSGGDAAAPIARDVFVEAMGQPVAPLTLGAAERGDAEASAAAEVAKVAATMG